MKTIQVVKNEVMEQLLPGFLLAQLLRVSYLSQLSGILQHALHWSPIAQGVIEHPLEFLPSAQK